MSYSLLSYLGFFCLSLGAVDILIGNKGSKLSFVGLFAVWACCSQGSSQEALTPKSICTGFWHLKQKSPFFLSDKSLHIFPVSFEMRTLYIYCIELL